MDEDDTPRLGDLLAERRSAAEERVKTEMAEACDKVRATGARDSKAYVEAVRGVLHKHGMLMADEVD